MDCPLKSLFRFSPLLFPLRGGLFVTIYTVAHRDFPLPLPVSGFFLFLHFER
ncbi:unnamed protein product [Phytomonas sp. Hart1]|nr:unnamed protein product [Phytomonas sp. Hart1]|eukprot:CCW67549.1 unnamed protein product [Phytomonas sp. isolate Hart1]